MTMMILIFIHHLWEYLLDMGVYSGRFAEAVATACNPKGTVHAK
jgi:hypothetical protein